MCNVYLFWKNFTQLIFKHSVVNVSNKLNLKNLDYKRTKITVKNFPQTVQKFFFFLVCTTLYGYNQSTTQTIFNSQSTIEGFYQR